MRNVILLLILAAGLWLMNRAAVLLEDWHYVVPAEPGAVLYTATFDEGQGDWALYDGRLAAQIQDAALRIHVDAVASAPYSTAAPYFADFDLRVQARPVEGPIDNGYGVVFRVQDPQNYYMFLVSSDGYYQVQRAVDGVERELSTWIPSPRVVQGLDVDNWLRVVAQGETFEFYVNGQQVELCIPDDPEGESTYFGGACVQGQMMSTLTDGTLPNGQLGVVARSFDERGVVVAFDNVLVYGPEQQS